MNLGQMLNQTGAIESIARELNIDPQTAKTGAAVLLPAIVAGMGRDSVGAAASRAPDAGLGGLGSILGGLAGASGGAGGLLDLVLGQGATPVSQGNDILGQIFGSKDVSRSVATEAAGASGMDANLLKKMLPLLTMAVVGYLAKQGQGGGAAPSQPQTQPNLGGILGSLVTGMLRR
ncbi:DUF937 domain-containing protein [Altererythrobacter sp. MF3-039]|uniref:DUF937 domain-containing protein n=1 Tax=Altererythrobacter sp. MF3-039 TaxID=3252901 RepID=UPI00390C6778